jgi:hypothetical protein
MNERIEGLWWKARIGYNNQNCEPEVLEKFAELIVKECLEACSRANEIRHFVPPTKEQVVVSCMREIEDTFWIER